MSHYAVTVLLSAALLEKHGGKVEPALAEILEPYEESPKKKKYLEFEDEEDEYRNKYETETMPCFKLASGALHPKYDPAFTVTDKDRPWSSTQVPPPGAVEIEVPRKEIYKTFDEYMADYNDMKRDPKTERYGHWRNPNAKWDWYSIGGRWMGLYPVKPGVKPVLGQPGVGDNKAKPGYSDVIRAQDLDLDRVRADQIETIDKFWDEYLAFVSGARFDTFDGPRSQLLDRGLLRVEEDKDAPIGPSERVIGGFWGDAHQHINGTARHYWRDVVTVLKDKQALVDGYADTFIDIVTFAALDDKGWHAPGRMGWFGVHDAEGSAFVEYCKSFYENFIAKAGPGDLLVCVDCHI